VKARDLSLSDVVALWPDELRWFWVQLYLKGRLQALGAFLLHLLGKMFGAVCILAFAYALGASLTAGALSAVFNYPFHLNAGFGQ
ncbi:hypothetical protein ACGHBA_006439, partial [Pseudomonas aeruginosa]